MDRYKGITQRLGGELRILLEVSEEELSQSISPKIVQGIMWVRQGRVKIKCGYDGVYGKVNIFSKEKEEEGKQLNLF